MATAGIPEQLFGGPPAAHQAPPAGQQGYPDTPFTGAAGPEPDTDLDSDGSDSTADVDMGSESDPAWESMLRDGLESSQEQSGIGLESSQEQGEVKLESNHVPGSLEQVGPNDWQARRD